MRGPSCAGLVDLDYRWRGLGGDEMPHSVLSSATSRVLWVRAWSLFLGMASSLVVEMVDV
jgi:hypothetical protein